MILDSVMRRIGDGLQTWHEIDGSPRIDPQVRPRNAVTGSPANSKPPIVLRLNDLLVYMASSRRRTFI